MEVTILKNEPLKHQYNPGEVKRFVLVKQVSFLDLNSFLALTTPPAFISNAGNLFRNIRQRFKSTQIPARCQRGRRNILKLRKQCKIKSTFNNNQTEYMLERNPTQENNGNAYIPKIEFVEQSDEEYWDMVSKGRKVVPLVKPCKDCAVVTGFYKEQADSLSEQSKDIQEKVMDTWFCHNHVNRGCAGVRKYLSLINTHNP